MGQIEFGEKLKKRREERGMTQQTLADKLYVTRQAVSRWECGARFPDLITAKRIADELEISLDELVSGEKYVRDIEKEPVITTPVPLMIQTVLYAVACVPYLIMCCYDIGVRIPSVYEMHIYGEMHMPTTIYFGIMIVGNLINFLLMAAGLRYSVRNELSSRLVGWIMSTRFFLNIVIMITTMPIIISVIGKNGGGTLSWDSKVKILLYCVAPLIILRYFNAKQPVNVKYVYIVVCILSILCIYDTWKFTYYIRYDIKALYNIKVASDIDSADHILNLINLIGNFAYTFLLAFQAYILNKKRKCLG